jgi:hypothetical protein
VLHVSELLDEIDAFHRARRRYPRSDDGAVNGRTDLTWCGVDQALRKGNRGLRPGSSLARFLQEHRGVRNRMRPPAFARTEVLAWLDAHHKREGEYPSCYSGRIPESPDDTWMAVDQALRQGRRGFPGGASLADFIAEHRGFPNRSKPPHLKPKTVGAWCLKHKKRTDEWPRRNSGAVREAPGETWAAIDAAFVAGSRGLPGHGSLARFLAKEFGVRNPKSPPALFVSPVIKWAKAWRSRTGKLPTHTSGPIPEAPGETWGGVHAAFCRGARRLPKSSLYRVMHQHGL